MMDGKKSTLKKEIILYIAILLISALLLIGAVLIKLAESFLITQKINSSKTIVKYITSRMSNSITDINTEKIFPVFEGLFEGIKVIDSSGMIISDSGEKIDLDKQLKKSLLAQEDGIYKDIRISFPFDNHKSSIYILTSVYENRQWAGGVIIKISLEDIRDNIYRIYLLIAVFIVIDSLIFIIFATYLISQIVINPIATLVDTTKQVSSGNLNVRIDLNSQNEIGMLADSFNLMTKSLKEKIAALNKAADKFALSEKLASVGRLAAGVAHEIGNPLSSIQTYIEVLMKTDQKKDNKDILERMDKDVGRIDRIVRDLLNLAAPSRGILSSADINITIRGAIDIISGHNSFKTIQIKLSLSEELPHINIDEHKMQQVMINLLINAADAMPSSSGGEISISTELIEYRGKDSVLHHIRRQTDPEDTNFTERRRLKVDSQIASFKDGDRLIKIAVKDNGTGITAEDLPKIFDPFFTTKEPGKGTGLGLSVSNKIITDMGGTISATSMSNQGTTIEILLPAVNRYL